jgi:hypothetical protein
LELSKRATRRLAIKSTSRLNACEEIIAAKVKKKE